LIAPSWPLQRWGIDIVGKLTLAQGNYTFAIVAVEYFTKWVEAKPITNITSSTVQNSSGKISSVTTEFHNRSQSTMPSILIVACSRISATRSGRRSPSRLYTTQSQMKQWKKPTPCFFRQSRKYSKAKRRENERKSCQGLCGVTTQ
jgi:hypothetical protein